MLADVIKTLNPRQSLAARIVWIFGLMSVLLSVLAGQIVGNISRNAIERDIGALYANRAQHISDAIDLKISGSVKSLEIAERILGTNGLRRDGGDERRLVKEIRANMAEAVWIGVADLSGKIIAGDQGLLEGTSIADRKWFQSALLKLTVSAPEQVAVFTGLAGVYQKQPPPNFTSITLPITDSDGVTTGMAIAYLDLKWINTVWQAAGPTLADARQVEVLVYNRDGELLLSSGRSGEAEEGDLYDRITDAAHSGVATLGSLVTNNYLLGYARSSAATDFEGTGWTVVVREPQATAYRSANQLATTIALSSFLLGFALSVTAAMVTWSITRGLARIAASADALRSGAAQKFSAIEGTDEVARISRSLAVLFNSLKDSNLELEELNRNLDQKVTERTREVQRLSDETRNAALTRERLRMSRDLHDTLAHSMLAMLTQIRLMQKLYKAKPERLAEELGYAEQAAKEGLAKARDAVIELRYFAVRDDGLEQALKKLVKRLKERVEIEANLEIDEAAAALAGPKAETVYRVAEEALHNIEKHADAHHVNIRVALNRENPASHLLSIVIEDDGKGFEVGTNKQGHFGLIGMREQADILGANLVIESTPMKGTRVHFVVPL